jgi:hypothetical protein
MAEVEPEVDGFSLGDKTGCFILYLLIWIPFTLLMIGFAGSLANYVEGIIDGAANGEILAIIYLLFTLPLLAILVLAANALSTKRRVG